METDPSKKVQIKSTQEPLPTISFHRIMLKAKYSFYSAVVFFLFANPETARVFQRFFGSTVTFLSNGALTMTGMFIQTILFFVTMLSLMLLPMD